MSVENPIRNFMTFVPMHIQIDVSLDEAANMMVEKNISHLPVFHQGKICGIVSQRDVKAALASSLELGIKDIMNESVEMLLPETSIRTALKIMTEKKIGSIVVHEVDGSIVGIFTTTDAMYVLNSLLGYLEGDLLKQKFWDLLEKEFQGVKLKVEKLWA